MVCVVVDVPQTSARRRICDEGIHGSFVTATHSPQYFRIIGETGAEA
jgi:hypothetical protein